MNILIVSRAFYPEISPRSFRATELAKELSRQGHDVSVLCPCSKEQDILIKKFGIKIIDLGPLKWRSIVINGNRFQSFYRRVFRRLGKLLFEFPDIELVGLLKSKFRQMEDFDLLISIAVPHPIHWGLSAIRTTSKPLAKVWIADCGDPYMGSENDSMKPMFYFKYLEKRFCRKADYISVPTEGSRKAYYPEFDNKIVVIPQGFKFEDVEFPISSEQNKQITFGYAGGFIPGIRDPRPLLEFLNTLNVDFRFYIYTRQSQYIDDLVRKSKGRIICKGFLPRIDLLKEMSSFDFLINLENLGSRQTPSKLIDYSILKKPILSLNSRNLDTVKLNRFLNYDFRESFKVDNVDQYRIENVAKQFLNLYSNYVQQQEQSL